MVQPASRHHHHYQRISLYRGIRMADANGANGGREADHVPAFHTANYLSSLAAKNAQRFVRFQLSGRIPAFIDSEFAAPSAVVSLHERKELWYTCKFNLISNPSLRIHSQRQYLA